MQVDTTLDGTPAPVPAHPHQGTARRNFIALVLEWGVFGGGQSFANPATVMPSFLNLLGAPAIVLGLLPTLQSAAWLLPQLFIARSVSNIPYKKPFIMVMSTAGRLSILLLAALVLFTGAQPASAGLLIAMTLLAVVVFWVSNGLTYVPWFDLIGRMIPSAMQGRLLGTGQALFSLFGFGAGIVVEWVLGAGGMAFPANFASLFLISGLVSAGAVGFLFFLRENRSDSAASAPAWRDYFGKLIKVIQRDAAYRRHILTRLAYTLFLLIANPFYMVYALDRLNLPAQVAGRYTSIGVAGAVLASVIFARINERYGSRQVIWAGAGTSVLIPISALLIPQFVTDPLWLAWVYALVFFLNNFVSTSFMPGWLSYVSGLASQDERPAYLGLTSTLIGISSMVFSALGGVLLELTGRNYNLLFGVAAAGLLLVFPLVLSLPAQRRKGI
jgi:Na+/melibiose symporter-like transporter